MGFILSGGVDGNTGLAVRLSMLRVVERVKVRDLQVAVVESICVGVSFCWHHDCVWRALSL